MSLADRTETQLRAFMPPDKARRKAASIGRGVVFFVLGALCFASAFGLVAWIVVTTKGTPSVALLIFASLLAIPGAYFLFAGGHIVSGEAMDAAAGSGNVIARTAAKALRLARGKEA